MVDILLTDGRQLPTECESCLELIRLRAIKPILDVYCSTTGYPALLVAMTTEIVGRVDIKVVGAIKVVTCPRSREKDIV